MATCNLEFQSRPKRDLCSFFDQNIRKRIAATQEQKVGGLSRTYDLAKSYV